MKKRSSITTLLVLTAAFWFTQPTHAQDTPVPSIHWAYASFFGSGWYKISDERSGFIMRVTPRWTVGEAGFDDDGSRNIAFRIGVPLTAGISELDFDDLPGAIDRDNLATASINLSADVDIPVTERFSLRPTAEIGYGTVIDDSESAWTYKASLRGRYKLGSGKFDWALIMDVGVVGFESNKDESDNFSYASAGAEFGQPVNWLTSENRQSMLYWRLKYVDFLDDISLRTGLLEFDSIANYWQFGLAFGRRDNPVKIWRFSFDRLGLAYDYSSDSQLRGIKFVFSSLYDT